MDDDVLNKLTKAEKDEKAKKIAGQALLDAAKLKEQYAKRAKAKTNAGPTKSEPAIKKAKKSEM